MTVAPPPNVMLASQQLAELQRLARSLDKQGLWWASGYLAALAADTSSAPDSATARILILYGSQTGNSKKVADQLAAALRDESLAAEAVSMAQFRPRALLRESHVYVVVSTHGEGEPPDTAVPLHRFLMADKAPRLERLRYAVFGLGDSSYEHFCQTAIDFDERLAALGATRLQDRVETDLDFAEHVGDWVQKVIAEVRELAPVGQQDLKAEQLIPTMDVSPARLLTRGSIVGRSSPKDIHHLELEVDEAFSYTPGDSVAVIPRPADETIDTVLAAAGWRGSEQVELHGTSLQLADALATRELSLIDLKTARAIATALGWSALGELLEQSSEARSWLASRQLSDLLLDAPGWRRPVGNPQTLLDCLVPTRERLFSVASSAHATPGEVHLTIARVAYQNANGHRLGTASCWLTGLDDDTELELELRANEGFRLPEADNPIVMVGAGTGVAPFRAFAEEMAATGRALPSWLFFGNPHFRTDFLYQAEWQRHLDEGVLSKIDLAWSRDRRDSCYVQHRVRQRSRELVDWAADGAHFYFCGSIAMGEAVQQALRESFVEHHGAKAGEQRFEALLDDQRLHRDLY